MPTARCSRAAEHQHQRHLAHRALMGQVAFLGEPRPMQHSVRGARPHAAAQAIKQASKQEEPREQRAHQFPLVVLWDK